MAYKQLSRRCSNQALSFLCFLLVPTYSFYINFMFDKYYAWRYEVHRLPHPHNNASHDSDSDSHDSDTDIEANDSEMESLKRRLLLQKSMMRKKNRIKLMEEHGKK